MKKIAVIVSAFCMLTAPLLGTAASPEQDLKDFRAYFTERFPDVPLQDFANGVYSVDKASRDQWEAFEEFAPYEIYVEKGEACSINHFKMAKPLPAVFQMLKKA